MGNLVLSQQKHVAPPPGEVFAMLGRDKSAGWLFGAEYYGLTVGSLVRFDLPVNPADPGSATIDASGRIASVEPPHRIVIDQQMPWPGRVSCSMTPGPGGQGTDVRLTVDVPEDSVTWLLRQRGYDPLEDEPGPGAARIGLLTSKSGPASVFAAATENLARLAADEVNADRGVGGRRVEVVVRDDASQPDVGAAQFRRMVRSEGCRVVVTNVTSEVFDAVQPLAKRMGVLLIYTPVNEGGPAHRGIVRLGERPRDQLELALPSLLKESAGRRCYLAGNDYVWPRTSNRVARAMLTRAGADVVGEQYRPMGSSRFDDLIDDIIASGADVLISTFVGSDSAQFERQCFAAGLREKCRTLSLAFDESTREFAGDEAARGVWTAFGYFRDLGFDGNTGLLRRYAEQYGITAPPPSSITQSVYEVVHMLAATGALAQDASLSELALKFRSGRLSGDWPSARPGRGGPGPLYLAESVAGGFRILEN